MLYVLNAVVYSKFDTLRYLHICLSGHVLKYVYICHSDENLMIRN